MQYAACLSAFLYAASACAAAMSLVNQSPCHERGGTRSSGQYGEVLFLPRGNDLLVKHTDYRWYCCLESSAYVDIEEGDITLAEVNRNGICRCICHYDLSYLIQDIPDGTYTVHFITHDGTEIAHQTLTFPSGHKGLSSLTVSECLTQEGRETVEVKAEKNTLYVAHRYLPAQCCSEITVRYTVREDEIAIYEYDESPAACFCMCTFDLEAVFGDIPSGSYRVVLYGLDGAVKAEQRVTVPGGSSGSFVRGEINGDGKVDLADAVFCLGYLFGGGAAPRCLDSADTNDDGKVDISDAVFLLGYLFGGTATLPDPFPDAGSDPTGDSLPACR